MKKCSPVVIPITILEENIVIDSLEMFKILRPTWNTKDIKSKVFTNGLTNKLTGFYLEGRENEMILVRIYGKNSEMFIDREKEIQTIKTLYENECGGELYATFNNGICYEFIIGDTLTMEQCWSPTIYSAVAKELAKLHSRIPISNPSSELLLWKKFKYFNILVENIVQSKDNEEFIKRFSKFGCDIKKGFNSQIEELKNILEEQNMPVTFCHNDLLLGNIIYDKENSKVTFIDVEWSYPNYAPVDVANHFLEFAGLDTPDFSKCPDREFRSKWISEYMKHVQLQNFSFSQESFEKWVELCLTVPHLMWTIVAIIQAHDPVMDFDYIGYATLRYSEFEKLMKEIQRK